MAQEHQKQEGAKHEHAKQGQPKQNRAQTKNTAAKTQKKKGGHQPKKKKSRLHVTLVNLAVFLVIAGGFIWLVRGYFHIGNKDFTNAAQVEEFINPINSRVSAYIKEIRFNEHQHVKKGDTLILLDDREVITQLEQAEAAYQNALASKKVATSSVNTIANNISVTDANIAGAKARMMNAEKNLHRYENLVQSEAVTRYQYDQVKTEYDVSKASYEALLKQKQSAGLSTAEAKSRLGLSDGEIKRAHAALEMARLNLSYTVITAPYDGIMGRRTIREGQLLQQPGMQVATIVSNENKWVTANFLESQMPNIRIGQKIEMTADAVGDTKFEGVVTAISGATGSRYSAVPTDNSSGNFVKVQQRIPVRIEFTGNNAKENVNRLSVGMNMNVYLKKSEARTLSASR